MWLSNITGYRGFSLNAYLCDNCDKNCANDVPLIRRSQTVNSEMPAGNCEANQENDVKDTDPLRRRCTYGDKRAYVTITRWVSNYASLWM